MVNNGYYATNRMKFGPRVQERALGIFNRGGVKLESFDGRRAFAQVQGTKLYRVEFTFSEDHKVEKHHCTCPFHDNYNGFCKHEIATLLALDQEGKTFSGSGKESALLSSPSKNRNQINAYRNALQEAKNGSEKNCVAQCRKIFKDASENLERSAMLELALRFSVLEMKEAENKKDKKLSFTLTYEAMRLLPIPEQKRILREIFVGLSTNAKSQTLLFLSSFPFPEEIFDFLAALIDSKDLYLMESLEKGVYFGLFRDRTLAKLVRYTPLSSLPPLPHLIQFVESHHYWETFASFLLSSPARLGEENAAMLQSVFVRLPKEENLFYFLHDNISRDSYENDLLKYFHSFSMEARKRMLKQWRNLLQDIDMHAYQLCAGTFYPERLAEFYRFSPTVLAICKEDLMRTVPEETRIAIPKYLEREMKRFSRARRVEEEDLREVFSLIEAYSEFPEVIQTLRNPLLDQWSFHYGSKTRTQYLLMLEDMPSFIGMRRF